MQNGETIFCCQQFGRLLVKKFCHKKCSWNIFQVRSAAPSCRLVDSPIDRFRSTFRPFSNHMSGCNVSCCKTFDGFKKITNSKTVEQNILTLKILTCNLQQNQSFTISFNALIFFLKRVLTALQGLPMLYVNCKCKWRKCPISNSHWQLQIDICPLKSSWHQKYQDQNSTSVK